MKRKLILILSALIVMVSSISIPSFAAGGWLAHVQEYKIGEAHNDMLTESDFTYKSGDSFFYTNNVVDAYRFSLKEDSILDIYLESSNGLYFDSEFIHNWYEIYSVSDPDTLISNIKRSGTYSKARNIYYGTANAYLPKGDYYILVGHAVKSNYSSNYLINDPYTLTISQKPKVVNVSAIVLSKDKLSLPIGSSAKISATVYPVNATDKTIIWSSSNSSVAKVVDGNITALKAGNAIIKAMSADGVISSTCEVIVKKDYTREITAVKNIKPSITSISKSGKKIKVKYSGKNSTQITYYVQFKVGKNGKWKSANNLNSKVKWFTKKNVKKTYYVRVRGFRTINGKTYYTKWSDVKKKTY